MKINGVEFTLCENDTFEGIRFATVRYTAGWSFGTLHLDDIDRDRLMVSDVHRRDVNNKDLMGICDMLDDCIDRLISESEV